MAVHLSIQSVSVLQKYQTVMLLHVAKEWKPKKGVVFKETRVVIGEGLLWGLVGMAPWCGKMFKESKLQSVFEISNDTYKVPNG